MSWYLSCFDWCFPKLLLYYYCQCWWYISFYLMIQLVSEGNFWSMLHLRGNAKKFEKSLTPLKKIRVLKPRTRTLYEYIRRGRRSAAHKSWRCRKKRLTCSMSLRNLCLSSVKLIAPYVFGTGLKVLRRLTNGSRDIHLPISVIFIGDQ